VLGQLAQKGWQITVFCLTERGDRAEELENAGVRIASGPPIARDKRSPLAYALHLIVASSKLYGLMREWKPRIAHFYLPAPYLVGAPVAIAARIPIKIMSRRSLSDYQVRWPGVRQLERLLHRRMDAIVGNCRAVLNQLISEGVPESKLRLIYNGLDNTPGPQVGRVTAREMLGLEQDAFVVVNVANLLPYKGHRDLIEGLASIARELPDPWHLLCAGRDGGVRSDLEILVRKRGLTGNVRFLGLSLGVDLLLAAADIGALTPIANEGFSNAILECMQAGLPMVATDIGGNSEAVLDGETGFVVPAYKPAAIGQSVLKLASDPQLRKRFGKKARQRVRYEFALEKWTDAQDGLYQSLLVTNHE
jgi:glycosyltransferase involved in cell wall biosynthesis